MKMLESLGTKLDLLKECKLIRADKDLLKVIDEYLKRCKSFY